MKSINWNIEQPSTNRFEDQNQPKISKNINSKQMKSRYKKEGNLQEIKTWLT